ncbi:MAG: hypothetical protein OEN21_17605 [Myxococcales bacterium]|nr:hypothetical protein [Myxococcales bacterium]
MPRPDMSLIPPLTGDSIRLNFRADHVTHADIEAHMRLLEARAPYVAITLSDVLRSLIQEGAKSFRDRLPEYSTDESTKNET